MTENLPEQVLEGKVAIVTGSSRGLGASIALELANRGAKIVVTYVSESSEAKAAETVSAIKKLPNHTLAIKVRADLGDVSSPKRIVEESISAFGPRIDILVNNAAVQITKPLKDITIEDYESVFNINIRGVVLMTQATLPYLGPFSRIINLSSVGGRAGFANLSLYSSSKAGIEGLTRSWASELGENGTTVNAVSPGPVESEMLNTIPHEIIQSQKNNTPVQKRLGGAVEVAKVVTWLASPESSWVSGQTINVSGGWTMY